MEWEKKKHIIFTIQTLINNNDNMQNEKCFSKFKREKKTLTFLGVTKQ
jgi:hypothetical protein